MSRPRFVLLLLLTAALAMLFVAMNPQVVTLELAWFSAQPRLGVVLVSALALGVLVGVLLRGMWVAELLEERGRLRRALKLAEDRARRVLSAVASDADRP